MGMGPGVAFSWRGVKNYMPINDYGEFHADMNPNRTMARVASAATDYNFGKIRGMDTIQEASAENRRWNNLNKKIGKVAEMSNRHRASRKAYMDLQKRMEMKKISGEPATEQEMQQLVEYKYELNDLQDRLSQTHSRGAKMKALRASLTPAARSRRG